MALTDAQKNRISEISVRDIFSKSGKTATVHKDDFIASAEAIDTKLDTAIASGEVGIQFDVALNAAIPSPVSGLTAAERALHFAIMIAVRHGAL